MTSSHVWMSFIAPYPGGSMKKAALYQEFCLHTISWNIHTIIAYNPHLFIIIMYTVKLRKRLGNSPMLYYIHLVPLPSHLIASSMQILTGRFHYRRDKEDFITLQCVTGKISIHAMMLRGQRVKRIYKGQCSTTKSWDLSLIVKQLFWSGNFCKGASLQLVTQYIWDWSIQSLVPEIIPWDGICQAFPLFIIDPIHETNTLTK